MWVSLHDSLQIDGLGVAAYTPQRRSQRRVLDRLPPRQDFCNTNKVRFHPPPTLVCAFASAALLHKPKHRLTLAHFTDVVEALLDGTPGSIHDFNEATSGGTLGGTILGRAIDTLQPGGVSVSEGAFSR